MISSRARNLSIVVGVVLWFAAAMTVHLLPFMFDGGWRSAIMFAAGIPLAMIFVPLTAYIVRPKSGEYLPMVVWGLIAATLLDGLAVTFSPALYAGVASATQFGLAWIIWGVGLFLLMGLRGR